MGGAVVVEVIALWGDSDGAIGYRQSQAELGDAEHPDALARTLADDGRLKLLHSTSWRFLPTGQVMLTYAAVSDGNVSGQSSHIEDFEPASSGDPMAPCPVWVTGQQVAAHAARHLAFLAATDPNSCATLTEALRSALDRLPAGLAGALPRSS